MSHMCAFTFGACGDVHTALTFWGESTHFNLSSGFYFTFLVSSVSVLSGRFGFSRKAWGFLETFLNEASGRNGLRGQWRAWCALGWAHRAATRPCGASHVHDTGWQQKKQVIGSKWPSTTLLPAASLPTPTRYQMSHQMNTALIKRQT